MASKKPAAAAESTGPVRSRLQAHYTEKVVPELM